MPTEGLEVTASQSSGRDLLELLAKGPVLLLENDARGRFDRTTAVVAIAASPAEVFAVAIDFARYREFLPKTLLSEPTRISADQVEVRFKIDVPFSSSKYTFRYRIDAARQTLRGDWIAGDLPGSFCEWRLCPGDGRTLLYYTAAIRNFSALAKAFEDDQQTLTVGINAVVVAAVAKAVKRRVEALRGGLGPSTGREPLR